MMNETLHDEREAVVDTVDEATEEHDAGDVYGGESANPETLVTEGDEATDPEADGGETEFDDPGEADTGEESDEDDNY